MRGEIEALQKRLGVTTVYVTHDQVEAMTMGDRVAVLRAGELQQVASPTDIYDRPANLFVASFIGSPPMNLAQGTIEGRDGAFSLVLGEALVPLAPRPGLAAGKSVIVGVRPEDIQLARGESPNGTIRAAIERIEALGSSLLGYFRVDAEAPSGGAVAVVTEEALEDAPIIGTGTLFCAAFEPRAGVKEGDAVDVTLNTEHLHFFDPETEAALSA
jgi:multiple sugar transport system ATP-binding protein